MNKLFLERVLVLAKESYDKGHFPAGAIVVRNDEIIAESISGAYPKANHHGESNALDHAIDILNAQLTDCTLYTSMESCLMCLGRAYWTGVSKIVYIIPRSKVSKKLAYEGDHSTAEIASRMNRNIEIIHDDTFEAEAMKLYKKWEKDIRKVATQGGDNI